MAGYLTDERIKELFEKREYYYTHPEESHQAWLKRDDGYVPIGRKPDEQQENEKD